MQESRRVSRMLRLFRLRLPELPPAPLGTGGVAQQRSACAQATVQCVVERPSETRPPVPNEQHRHAKRRRHHRQSRPSTRQKRSACRPERTKAYGVGKDEVEI